MEAAQFELGCMCSKRPKKGQQKTRSAQKKLGVKLGRKLLETRIGPQMTWAKSYVAPMTRQLPPWRTHGTYVAMQIRDGKISYVDPTWQPSVTEKIVTDYRAQPGLEWVEWAWRPSMTVEIGRNPSQMARSQSVTLDT